MSSQLRCLTPNNRNNKENNRCLRSFAAWPLINIFHGLSPNSFQLGSFSGSSMHACLCFSCHFLHKCYLCILKKMLVVRLKLTTFSLRDRHTAYCANKAWVLSEACWVQNAALRERCWGSPPEGRSQISTDCWSMCTAHAATLHSREDCRQTAILLPTMFILDLTW